MKKNIVTLMLLKNYQVKTNFKNSEALGIEYIFIPKIAL